MLAPTHDLLWSADWLGPGHVYDPHSRFDGRAFAHSLRRLLELITMAERRLPDRDRRDSGKRGAAGRRERLALVCEVFAAAAVDAQRGSRRALREFVCTTFWHKGREVCDDDTPVPMDAADRAVRDLLLTHVLRANIVNAAIDMAVTMFKDHTDPLAERRAALKSG